MKEVAAICFGQTLFFVVSLPQLHSEREESYEKLQKHREMLKNDQHNLQKHDKEHARLQKIAARAAASASDVYAWTPAWYCIQIAALFMRISRRRKVPPKMLNILGFTNQRNQLPAVHRWEKRYWYTCMNSTIGFKSLILYVQTGCCCPHNWHNAQYRDVQSKCWGRCKLHSLDMLAIYFKILMLSSCQIFSAVVLAFYCCIRISQSYFYFEIFRILTLITINPNRPFSWSTECRHTRHIVHLQVFASTWLTTLYANRICLDILLLVLQPLLEKELLYFNIGCHWKFLIYKFIFLPKINHMDWFNYFWSLDF